MENPIAGGFSLVLSPSLQRTVSRLRSPRRGLWVPFQDLWRPPSRITLHYGIAEISKTGKRGKMVVRPAHSWTKQGAQWLPYNIAGTNGLTVENAKRTSGVDQALTVNANWNWKAAAAILTSGIQAGSGTTAESSVDFVLATPIIEGVAAGQLNYAADQGFTPVTGITGGYRIFQQRTVTNNSGGNVVIREIALYAIYNPGGVNTTHCILRDVLASIETVVTGTGRVIQYSFDLLN